MNGKFSIAAATGLFLATASCADAVSLTSDPIATMNEEQKLGPNSFSYRLGNQTYTFPGPPAYNPPYQNHDRHRHYRNWR
jgi:hypothetical protein